MVVSVGKARRGAEVLGRGLGVGQRLQGVRLGVGESAEGVVGVCVWIRVGLGVVHTPKCGLGVGKACADRVPRLGVAGFLSRVGLGVRLMPRRGGGTPRRWVFSGNMGWGMKGHA
ncbi:hypothetical protein PIB30_092972 [Stylosanthes scabra]|uniref:Uncharacterized protein n=1 Tax=Stylosanthes scabra TaxID=79078 RepID=A0ABU6ZU08_9FABA|nr:hypothetical protein [Stylosanthes scabra]